MTLDDILNLAQLAGLDESTTETLLFANLTDPELAEDLNTIALHEAAPRMIRQTGCPPSPREISDGEIFLGTIPEDQAVSCLQLEELQKHMFIGGASGSGKTVTVLNISTQAMELGVNALFFDLMRGFRGLLREYDVLVFRGTDFMFNPLQVPTGMSAQDWAQTVSIALAQPLAMLTGSESWLLTNILELYQAFGVLEGETSYPTLTDLLEYCESKRYKKVHSWGREYKYLDLVVQRLRAVTAVFEGMNCSQGYNIDTILSRNVIIELDGMDPHMVAVLVEPILYHILHHRMAQGQRGLGLRNLIVFDEAKTVMPIQRERNQPDAVSNLAVLIARIREFMIGLIVTEQQPSLLVNAIKANSYTKILMKLGHGQDLEDMARSMGLNHQQKRHASLLDTGQAIVKLSGRWPQPFFVMFPDYPLDKSVTDEEVAEHMQPYLQELEWAPRTDVISKVMQEAKDRRREERLAKKLDDELAFLREVAENPGYPVTERYERLGWSPKKGVAIKDRLLGQFGYVELVEVDTGNPGRKPQLLEITEKGLQRLSDANIQVRRSKGKGSPLHCFWQRTVADYFRNRGFSAKVEGRLRVKNVDVLVTDPDHRNTAVEITIQAANVVENITRDLEDGADHIIVACYTDGVMKAVEKKIGKALGKDTEIEIKRVQEYYEVHRK